MAYLDKYGFTHNHEQEMNFANLSFDMMRYLTFEVHMQIGNCELLVSRLISSDKEGQVARDRMRTFIELIETHHKEHKRGKKD